MTIKAQPDVAWWPMQVAARVREVLPSSVGVVSRQDWRRDVVEVELRAPRWAVLRPGWREGVLARARAVVADAPAGVVIRVSWARP